MSKRKSVTAIVMVSLLAASGWLSAAGDNLRLLKGALRQASRGDTATAMQVIDRYLDQPGREPAKAYALFLKGMLLDGRGQTDSAESYLRTSIVNYPSSDWTGQSLVRLGLILSRNGRDTAAVRTLEPVAANFADSSFALAALIGIGHSARRSGLDSRALEAYLQYLRSGDNEQHLLSALQLAAQLLVAQGRAEEAVYLLSRISIKSEKTLSQQDLPVQIIAIGALTGVGMPDSALRVVEEIRRTSGDAPLSSPGLTYLVGKAHLAQDEFSSADSALSLLAGREGLGQEGVPPDSLFRLLMEIGLRRDDRRGFFSYAARVIELEDDRERALALLERIVDAAERTGMMEQARQGLDNYVARFGAAGDDASLALIRARFARTESGIDRALEVLREAQTAESNSAVAARILLERAHLHLADGDTLRGGALLRDYLASSGDPLHDKDRQLLAYAELQRDTRGVEAERELLEQLAEQYPASSYWQQATDRLEEIGLFESARPAEAAEELLDIYLQQAGRVDGVRLAEIAADKLDDYERALAIMQRENSQAPGDRLRLIRYKYLSALKLRREGSFEGSERLAQAWRDIRLLLSGEPQFPGRDQALETYLQILQRIGPTLGPIEISQAEDVLLSELAALNNGKVRTEVLDWLAGRFIVRAEADTGMAVMILADSARAMWTEAVGIAGLSSIGQQAAFSLAESLEGASFAGARDSAAGLYGRLAESDGGGRWASLAGLKLGAIHLKQERQFLAYRTISLWGEQHPYAVEDISYRTALAEASFLTGRYGRAVKVMDELSPGDLDTALRRRFDAYRIRALTALGDYGGAATRLMNFRDNYREPESERIVAVLATELYYSAGNPGLADSYRERLKNIDAYEELAELFSIQARLARGGDKKTIGKIRKDFEDLRDAPWNRFFRIDVAFQAYRGIMACRAAAGELDEVAESRDDFRRKYPERRAALAVLMLDEIAYCIDRGRLQNATSLHEDLELLFADVSPGDRLLWIGWRLSRAAADVAEANRRLTALAGKYPWSPVGKLARVELAGLYVSAGRADNALALLESVDPEAELNEEQTMAVNALIAGAENRWDDALDFRRRQWAALRGLGGHDKVVREWADAAVRAGRVSEALDVLSSFWSPDTTQNARARLALAGQYRAAGYSRPALGALDGVESIAGPRSEFALQALYRKGMLLEEMGRTPEAIKVYQLLEARAGQGGDWLRSARDRLRELQGQTGTDSTSQAGTR
ncbi:MAG: hypothetical protein FVQ81_05815 [Candidatus Glassbacteria bacterium]|nr:hypothetical protein [Candidatus Glassbacteria bacterium]